MVWGAFQYVAVLSACPLPPLAFFDFVDLLPLGACRAAAVAAAVAVGKCYLGRHVLNGLVALFNTSLSRRRALCLLWPLI